MPVVIHNRESDEDLIQILNKYKPRGVIHCFSGDINLAKKILKLNMMLSFTGIVTFKNSTLDEVIKNIDCKNIMLETDSPYLTPHPFRGKRNEPKHVKLIAEKIAKIKNISIETLTEITTENALNLFHGLR